MWVGAAVWNAIPLVGGGGVEGYPHQIYSSNMDNRQSTLGALVSAG